MLPKGVMRDGRVDVLVKDAFTGETVVITYYEGMSNYCNLCL